MIPPDFAGPFELGERSCRLSELVVSGREAITRGAVVRVRLHPHLAGRQNLVQFASDTVVILRRDEEAFPLAHTVTQLVGLLGMDARPRGFSERAQHESQGRVRIRELRIDLDGAPEKRHRRPPALPEHIALAGSVGLERIERSGCQHAVDSAVEPANRTA